jgi:preprotein translocase subunit SecG
MEVIVLSIHLLVCICLIGLVLLQRSEGGALGMGGGGGGALMSGRGAADALAKMTSVAGGFFLATSLGLTVLSGAGASADGRSVFDNIIPQSSAPAAPAPAPAAPPADERPDPTEGSVEPATQLAALLPGPAEAAAAPPTAPAPNAAATRAAPLPPASTTSANAQQRATTPPRSTQVSAPATTTPRPPAANTTTQRQTTPATTTQRQATTTQPQRTGAATTPASTTRPPVVPTATGAVNGINLEDTQTQPESVEVGNGLEAVRRQTRAGPDQ